MFCEQRECYVGTRDRTRRDGALDPAPRVDRGRRTRPGRRLHPWCGSRPPHVRPADPRGLRGRVQDHPLGRQRTRSVQAHRPAVHDPGRRRGPGGAARPLRGVPGPSGRPVDGWQHRPGVRPRPPRAGRRDGRDRQRMPHPSGPQVGSLDPADVDGAVHDVAVRAAERVMAAEPRSRHQAGSTWPGRSSRWTDASSSSCGGRWPGAWTRIPNIASRRRCC